MFVEKIEVPAFRVLRNVVLEFDRGHEPRIFPLGSENGGGKSTLLQLLFALLHCSSDPERFQYLANLLATDVHAGDEEERLIARLTIRLNDEQLVLEFVSLNDAFLKRHLGKEGVRLGFLAEPGNVAQRATIDATSQQLDRHVAAISAPWRPTYADENLGPILLRHGLGIELVNSKPPKTLRDWRDYLERTVKDLRTSLNELGTFLELGVAEFDRIRGVLVSFGYHYITTFLGVTDLDFRAIVCRVAGQTADRTEEILRSAQSKLFLLGPSNQQYLFLSKDVRKALLHAPRRESKDTARPQIAYMQHLDKAESAMSGFFAYDWLSVEPLVELFKAARDADFQHVVNTGKYGNRFTELYDQVSGLLINKKVRPLIDPETNHVVGVEFTVVDSNGQETPISSEDLSQGELKRLMIYAWLRAHRAVDALVLIDEIEASFHPDWQYGIIRDLQEWAPKNQYILATHSHELCTALTPAHVRALEPPLRTVPPTPSAGQK